MRKIILCFMILLLTGCSQAKEQVESQTNADAIVADSLGESHYAMIQRETNPDRNEYYATLSGTKDYKTIGRELAKLSMPYFSTDNHYMAEGQYLKSTHRQQLTKRTNPEKSEVEYPNSLQPDRGREIDGVDSPVMVGSIYEQDFYSDSSGETLVGVSFTIVLDPGDAENKQLSKPMSDSVIKAYGEEIIPKFYNYLMSDKELKKTFENIPINICVYQASNQITSNVDGRYILQCYSENSLGSINSLTFQNVLITSNEAKEIDNTTATEFETFKAKLKKLSVDAVGVVGYGLYQDNTLQTLEISVTINVKTYGELEFLISKSADTLQSAFSEVFDIKMKIISQDDIEAIIIKQKGKDVEIVYY